MNYECQEHYESEMGAGGAAEAEADAAAQYQEYLNYLQGIGEHYLWALEVITTQLSTAHFKESGLSAMDYLNKEKERLTNQNFGKPEPAPVIEKGKCRYCGKPCGQDETGCDDCVSLPF